MAGSAVLNLETLWKQSLSEVTADIGSPAQRRWLRETRPVGYNDDTVVLAAPHSFARQWLDSHCGDLLRTALSRSADRSLDVVITVQPNPAPVDPELAHATDHVQHPDTATGPSASSPPPQRGPLTSPSPQPPDGPSDAQPSPGTHAGGPMATSPQPPTDRGDPPDSPEADLVDPQAEPEAEDRDEPGVQPSADRISAVAERFPEVDPVTERTLGDTSRHGETTGEATTPAVRQPLQAPGRPPGPRARLPETKPADGHDETRLNPKYVFDHFVTGASNRFAHAAAFAVAEAPARAYNPLFIYGGAGLGKTHLLHAIGHYVRSLYPRLVARYLTTEQFTNEFINAIRDDSVVGFQRTYRRTDILLIDDIQFLENKERTQEEFFHTFNALHNAEKQIVVSSDRPPKQIARLEGRLRSRFEWGLMTDVQPPDLETRIAILKKKATYESLPVPDEVLELIASKVQSNIRELEGALIRVTAYASLQQTDVDGELAELVLKDLFPSQTPREISPSLIQEVVAEFFDFTVEELCSRSRTRRVVTARQIAMFLVRELTDLSLPRIGKVFGDRDHTTVMHARDKIQGLMKERQAIYDQVQELTTLIRNQACT